MADIWSATKRNDVAVVEFLLTEGEVPVDELNDHGETALHLAASAGHVEVLLLLLDSKAQLDIKDWESGWTPLHRSFYHGHIVCSMILLYYGAKVDETNGSSQIIFRNDEYFNRYSNHVSVMDHDGLSPIDLLSRQLIDKKKGTTPIGQSKEGSIFSFGKVDYQLGYHFPNTNIQLNPRKVYFPCDESFVSFSAARFHTIALSSTGKCYTWGFGKGGRLGTGAEINVVQPTLVEYLSSKIVVKISAGENHTLALTDDGQVYSWGSNSYGQLGYSGGGISAGYRLLPKRIDYFKSKCVSEIAAGKSHSAAICAGEVYTWGSNKKGQLGRKEAFSTDNVLPLPEKVDISVGNCRSFTKKFKKCLITSRVPFQISVGEAHMCIILYCVINNISYGQVWQWGHGSYSPTRVFFHKKSKVKNSLASSSDNAWTPRRNQMFENSISIVAISCAKHHSMALSVAGSVYTWGFGQDVLAHKSSISASNYHVNHGTPQLVEDLLKHGKAIKICASFSHCAVVMESGDLFTWGSGEHGMLGHGKVAWQPYPKKVKHLKNVIDVQAAAQHTVVLVSSFHHRLSSWEDVVLSTPGGIPSLWSICQAQLIKRLRITNLTKVLIKSEELNAKHLFHSIDRFIQLNFDLILSMMKDLQNFLHVYISFYMDSSALGNASESNHYEVNANTSESKVEISESYSKARLKKMSVSEICKQIKKLKKKQREINSLIKEKVSSDFTPEEKFKVENSHKVETALLEYLEYLNQNSVKPSSTLFSVRDVNTENIIAKFDTCNVSTEKHASNTPNCFVNERDFRENLQKDNFKMSPSSSLKESNAKKQEKFTSNANEDYVYDTAKSYVKRVRKSRSNKRERMNLQAFWNLENKSFKKNISSSCPWLIQCRDKCCCDENESSKKNVNNLRSIILSESAFLQNKKKMGKISKNDKFIKSAYSSISKSKSISVWAVDNAISSCQESIPKIQIEQKLDEKKKFTQCISSWGRHEVPLVPLADIQKDQLHESRNVSSRITSHLPTSNEIKRQNRQKVGGKSNVVLMNNENITNKSTADPDIQTKRNKRNSAKGKQSKKFDEVAELDVVTAAITNSARDKNTLGCKKKKVVKRTKYKMHKVICKNGNVTKHETRECGFGTAA